MGHGQAKSVLAIPSPGPAVSRIASITGAKSKRD